MNEQEFLTVITQENLGSSGGQRTGMKAAVERGYDWVWCMDDDTIPEINALENLLSSNAVTRKDTGFICSNVLWIDGNNHILNTHWPANLGFYSTILSDKIVEWNTCSFVSVVFSCKAIQKVGYPINDFFIWYDDVEFTKRITKAGYKGYIKLDSVVCHKTETNKGIDWNLITKENFFKYKYGIRNYIALNRPVFKRKGLRHRLKFHIRLVVQLIRIGIRERLTIAMSKSILEGYRYSFKNKFY